MAPFRRARHRHAEGGSLRRGMDIRLDMMRRMYVDPLNVKTCADGCWVLPSLYVSIRIVLPTQVYKCTKNGVTELPARLLALDKEHDARGEDLHTKLGRNSPVTKENQVRQKEYDKLRKRGRSRKQKWIA